jgi:tetratricopeptide (TPR) repeat protein
MTARLALAGLVVCLAPASASAQQPESLEVRARARFDAGVTALDAGDRTAALAAFKESYALVPQPRVLANIGALYHQLDRYVEAADAYERYLRSGDTPDKERAVVVRRLAELDTKLGKLVFEIETRDQVSVDDRSLGVGPIATTVRVTPGGHRIVIGAKTTVVDVTAGAVVPVAVREPKPVAVRSEPPPKPPPRPERRARAWWIPTAALAAGDIAVVTWLGLRSRQRVRDAEQLGRLPFQADYSEAEALIAGAESDVRWMKIGIGVGVGLGVATTLLFWRWHRDRGTRVTATVDPTGDAATLSLVTAW